MELLKAVGRGQRAGVERLLESGADVSQTDERQRTALHLAAEKDKADICALLLSHGAAVDAEDYRQNTPLHLAAAAAAAEAVATLVDEKASVGATNSFVETPLHTVCGEKDKAKKRSKIAGLLLAAGAQIDAQSKSGRTPLWKAASTGNVALIKDLLAAGADPSIAARGQQGTPLDAAREFKQEAAIKLLEPATES